MVNNTQISDPKPSTVSINADILVVDDTPDNVRFLSKILMEYGYRVRKAINGTMALTAVETQRPDLILLDIKMPDLDGYEVCQRLKENPPTAEIPVIFLSAWSDTHSKVKGFEVGGVDYITKPFQFEEVIARIETQLTITRLQSQLKQQNADLRQTLQELHQTQDKLVQEQKMASLGRFVAGVSHEINNPVSFIACNIPPAEHYIAQLTSLVRAYQEDTPEPTERIRTLAEEIDLDFALSDLKKIFRSIRNGAERIQTIVLALRIFSRLDEADFKPVDLHDGINSTLVLLQHRLDDLKPAHSCVSGVQVHKDYGDLPLVTCNAKYVNQAMFNLIENAINALERRSPTTTTTPDAPPSLDSWVPTLWIRTRMDDQNRVSIHIKDNGIGIHPDQVPYLFDPLFKNYQDSSAQHFGLGLHTAYQIIVEQHHGTITCQSTPNEGTEFMISLPIESRSNELNGDRPTL